MRGDNVSDAAGRRDDPAGGDPSLADSAVHGDTTAGSAKELDPKAAADTAPVEMPPGSRTALEQIGTT
jgi:hypothetical protein